MKLKSDCSIKNIPKNCFGCGVGIFVSKKHKHVKYCSKSCSKIGKNNPQWVADKVSYQALHSWVKRHFAKPLICDNCNQEKKLDLANISGEYKRELSDWEWLCRKCHMEKDGRLDKAIKSITINRTKPKKVNCLTCNVIFQPASNVRNAKYCSMKCFFNRNNNK